MIDTRVEKTADGGVVIDIELPVIKFERVGSAYANLMRKLKNNGALGNHAENSEEENSESSSNDADYTEVDVGFLKSLDPKEWKDQDHYKVLGLELKRIEATEDDIKRAYRKMVLNHHPDKRKAKGETVSQDNDYFTCITRAYEILGTPKSRISYDSVDPEFDDNLPTDSQIKNDYYNIFNKYFKLNARWSEKKNVPEFGDNDANRDQVDSFYNFWYDFESWREFSYLDEEDKEKGQDRDERRWIEKENRAARLKRKKEEMARIRTLVDLAFNNDKRIIRFKKEEKEKKLAAKRAKMGAAQAAKHEEERLKKEQELAKEKAEKEEQKRIEQIRYEREQQKRLVKKERKILRDRAKEANYFAKDDKDVVKNMENVEKICEMLSHLELQELNKEMEKGGKNVFFQKVKAIDQKLKEEREGLVQQKKGEGDSKPVEKAHTWNPENMQLLIKAVNLFPAGTAQRWEVIAAFLNQHSPTAQTKKFHPKDVLNKAKSLQQSDFSKSTLKTAANEAAFATFEKSKKVDSKIAAEKMEATVNLEAKDNVENKSSTANQKQTAAPATTKAPVVWSKEEQSLLEQAIKTYPVSTADRWDKIAECIPNKTKKDCLRRVKELVDLVNSKKEAQQGVK
ncbi:DNAJC2 family protein [Megaselia abdita]